MRRYKFLLIILFLFFRCASTGFVPQSGIPSPQKTITQGSVKGLKPMGIIGETKLGSSFLSHPTGIAIDPQGNLFIADTDNDRVVKCDGEGNFLKETGGFGWEEGQFNRPTFITTDNGLNIYVADTQNKRVQRFDRNLNFISTIPAYGGISDKIELSDDFSGFGLLEGIAVTSAGELLLSDIEDDCVIKLDNFYAYSRTFGGFGYGGGSLLDPLGISVDRKGNVYVADSQNDRVAIYDLFGNFLKSLGETTLRKPGGVTVGEDGLIYVANTEKNSIAIFNPEGNLVLEYGTWGSGMGNFSKPTDLKLGRDNKLSVVDSGNNRICVFEILR
ncbi:MAG: NHL repeat-containing protein [candidate division Zixibacteria bacterium]|nr:NHL repeat-containing protein [candidate division Zixibacteria bacterium]